MHPDEAETVGAIEAVDVSTLIVSVVDGTERARDFLVAAVAALALALVEGIIVIDVEDDVSCSPDTFGCCGCGLTLGSPWRCGDSPASTDSSADAVSRGVISATSFFTNEFPMIMGLAKEGAAAHSAAEADEVEEPVDTAVPCFSMPYAMSP